MASPKAALSALPLVFICIPSRGKIEWREPIALSPALLFRDRDCGRSCGPARQGKGNSDV